MPAIEEAGQKVNFFKLGGGDGEGGEFTSARLAWLAAARWLRRALQAAPRLRRRRRPAAWLPGVGGEAEEP